MVKPVKSLVITITTKHDWPIEYPEAFADLVLEDLDRRVAERQDVRYVADIKEVKVSFVLPDNEVVKSEELEWSTEVNDE